MEPKVKRRIQDHCQELRMPRVDWKSYTLDDIEEIIAFYLRVKTASDPMQDMQRHMANNGIELTPLDIAIYSFTPEGMLTLDGNSYD